MDEPTKPKRNQAEKKNKEQQIKESEIKNVDDDDDDNVFNEDSQKQQVYLLLCYACRLIFCMCALYCRFICWLVLFKIIKIIFISEIT